MDDVSLALERSAANQPHVCPCSRGFNSDRGLSRACGRLASRRMSTLELVVEEPLGAGLDLVVDDGRVRVVGAREARLWLGMDRARLEDSDAGDGSELPAVVALPASTFAGCRIDGELVGALVDANRTVLVARLPGHDLPAEAIVRTVARVGAGQWVDAAAAQRIAREARQRFRVRRQRGRVLGGRAWQAAARDPGERRFTTPHSRPEYRLDRLPPRFVRGLDGLLDPDERLLYSIERPPDALGRGPLGLTRRASERRAGLLLLTDRQLVWLVDHLPPDRYLFDWGVDARLIALEALRSVRLAGRGTAELHVRTRGGGAVFALPEELRAEAQVMHDLLLRFLPAGSTTALVRRYAPEPAEFDPGPATLFRQADEALQQVEAVRTIASPEPMLAAFYAPRREGVRQAITVGLTPTQLVFLGEGDPRRVRLDHLTDVGITLSPLMGRVELSQPAAAPGSRTVTFSYPATTAASATAFLRLLRKAWADRGSMGLPADESDPGATRRVA